MRKKKTVKKKNCGPKGIGIKTILRIESRGKKGESISQMCKEAGISRPGYYMRLKRFYADPRPIPPLNKLEITRALDKCMADLKAIQKMVKRVSGP